MHRPEKPQPRLTGRTVATTQRRPNGISVTTTEHYTVTADGATDEQLDGVIEKLNSILAAVRSTPTRG